MYSTSILYICVAQGSWTSRFDRRYRGSRDFQSDHDDYNFLVERHCVKWRSERRRSILYDLAFAGPGIRRVRYTDRWTWRRQISNGNWYNFYYERRSIGLLFFLGQSMATSLYILGFAESVVGLYEGQGASPLFGSFVNDERIIGVIAATAVLGVGLIGIGWYAKTQTALLLILLATVLSVFIGAFFPSLEDREENEEAGFVGFGNGDIPWKSSYTIDLSTGENYNFLTVFGVFFPAVTGIMAGANISGDLSNASTAIPKGTLSAIASTTFIYIGLLWFLGLTCVRCVGEACKTTTIGSETIPFGSREWADAINDGLLEEPDGGLSFDTLIQTYVSLWSPLVFLGIFAATLSSALASLVGAPRILQAVAKDQLYPWKVVNYFSQRGEGISWRHLKAFIFCQGFQQQNETYTSPDQTQHQIQPPLASDRIAYPHTYVDGKHSKAREEEKDGAVSLENSDDDNKDDPSPVRGYFLTYLITVACVSAGELNQVAPLITNFFILCYALTNFACFRASMAAMPGWRPSFKFYNKYVSLAGAIACVAILFALDWITALVSIVLGALLYKYIEWTDPPKNWGPASDAVRYVNAVDALFKLRKVKKDAAGRGHVKTFRPSYLLMVKDPRSLRGKVLISFIAKLYKGRGLAIVAQVLENPATGSSRNPNEVASLTNAKFVMSMRQRLRNQNLLDRAASNSSMKKQEDQGKRRIEINIDRESTHNTDTSCELEESKATGSQRLENSDGLDAFRLTEKQRSLFVAEVITADDVLDGLCDLLQIGGLGPLRPNTVVFSFPENWYLQVESEKEVNADRLKRIKEFEGMLLNSFTANLGVMVFRDNQFKLLDGSLVSENVGFRLPCTNRYPEVGSATKDTNDAPSIDLWWLADEGGLAVLIPHLLRQNPQFRDHKIRVFTVGAPDETANDATVDARHRSYKLGSLLTKLRISADYVSFKAGIDLISSYSVDSFNLIYPGILLDRYEESEENKDEERDTENKNKNEASKDIFNRLSETANLAPLKVDIRHLDKSMKMKLDLETRRVLRTGELMREVSTEASIIFVVLPYPRNYQPLGLLTAWSEMLTTDLPPTVLIRGNGEPVVTLEA